jgi:hypothetical protein
MCPGSVVQPFCEEYICCYFVLSQSLDVAERSVLLVTELANAEIAHQYF